MEERYTRANSRGCGPLGDIQRFDRWRPDQRNPACDRASETPGSCVAFRRWSCKRALASGPSQV